LIIAAKLEGALSLWAIMIGFTFMIGIYRFNQFVDRVLNEINKGRV